MSRAPNREFQEWWNKQRERNLDLSSDGPSTSAGGPLLPVEIRTPPSDQAVEKSRARSVRQLSWVCLLRFHQITLLVTSAAGSFVSILRTANRRIAASPADSSSSRLYRIIRFFLILVLVPLGSELLAYYKGWHFSPPSVGSKEVLGFVDLVYANWLEIRAKYLAPPLQRLTDVCIVLFLIQSVDRVVLVLGCLWIKIRGIKPVASINYEKKGDVDSEGGDEVYPMVLVQIPMCNEREVDVANENSDAKRCKLGESVANENCSGEAKPDPKERTGTASEDKQTQTEGKDYIHVRARRGQATDGHSLAERVRKEKISQRMKILQDLVPGCNKVTGKALMLDGIINYVQSLQHQVEFLSMKLASVNTSVDYKVDILTPKEMFQSNDAAQYPTLLPNSSAASVLYGHHQHLKSPAAPNIAEGTTTQCPMDPLNDPHFPPLDGSNDHVLAAQSFCGDDLQILVQMGFGQATLMEAASDQQNYHGQNLVSHMKIEL